jgi:hypothetical protein
MMLSAKTLDKLTNVLTGDTKVSPYRSGPMLIDFFYDFGERDLYGQGFPSRAVYTKEKLHKFNGTEAMKRIVCRAFDYFDEPDFHAEESAEEFNRTLTRDGFRLVIEYGTGWMQGNEYVKGNPFFEVRPLMLATVVPTSLTSISHEAITEHISKANKKIESGDFSGAITSAYTLVEYLLKLMLTQSGTTHNESEGDIRLLYKALRTPLRLDPQSEGIEGPLKPILDGFQKLVGGLYEISNKASDRHARRYNPAAHHAKLAVNAAFALCEFLVETHKYQKARADEIARKEAMRS